MQNVLDGLVWDIALVYLDDVIVVGKDFNEHVLNLREVFKRLRVNHLKLKPSKCKIFKKEVKSLGWNVGSKGLAIPEENVKALLERERPKSVKEVESFLGYVNYHRSHLQKLAQLAPLYKLKGSKTRKISSCGSMNTKKPLIPYVNL